MDAEQLENDVNRIFSTYGQITAQRILGKYHITLAAGELAAAIGNPFTFYHRLLQVPLKNVFNGIILQQANDYHVYAQKLFIDYLLSGETSKDEEAQGAYTRESLEEERKKLTVLGEDFHRLEIEHQAIIATSQVALMKLASEWNIQLQETTQRLDAAFRKAQVAINKNLIHKGLINVVIRCDLRLSSAGSIDVYVEQFNAASNSSETIKTKEILLEHLQMIIEFSTHFEGTLKEYTERAKDLSHLARSYRVQFYETILRVLDLIKMLPEYKIDPEQDQVNRESLYFDKAIGEY